MWPLHTPDMSEDGSERINRQVEVARKMNDRVAVFFDPCIFNHDTGKGFFEAQASPYLPLLEPHPESSERVRNMHAVLKDGPIAELLDWHTGETASRADLERFHSSAYIDELVAIPVSASRVFSSTTIFGPGSFAICRKAARRKAEGDDAKVAINSKSLDRLLGPAPFRMGLLHHLASLSHKVTSPSSLPSL